MIKSKQVCCSHSDLSVLILKENDIKQPSVYNTSYDLKSYTIQHLKTWLTYRRDSLKNVETLKEVKVKVLQFFGLRTEKKLIDQAPSKICLIKKAKLMHLTLGLNNLLQSF